MDRLDARVEALNDEGMGKWSRNGLAVILLTNSVARLERGERLSGDVRDHGAKADSAADDAPTVQATVNTGADLRNK